MRVIAVALACAACAHDGAWRPDAPLAYTLVDAREAEAHSFPGPDGAARCAIVHVDGFDNTLEDARENFDVIAAGYTRAGGACKTYGFAWRSDHGLFGLRSAEREVDARAGASLVRFLDELERAYAATDIQLTAHSLGARVVLRALERRAALGRAPLGAVALVAPAIPSADAQPGGELWAGIDAARRIAIFRNSRDRILGSFYPLFAGGQRALGQLGYGEALAAVTLLASRRGVELVDVDCASLWSWHHSAQRSFDSCFWEMYLSLVAPSAATRI